MSEEEIIKRVRNVANGLKFTQEFQGNEMYEEDIQAIQGLLELYQKEKKKAETLAKINESVEILKGYELLDDAIYVAALSPNISAEIDTKYVSKDKIREVLEYYEHVPVDDTDSIIAFYSDIKKLLEEK